MFNSSGIFSSLFASLLFALLSIDGTATADASPADESTDQFRAWIDEMKRAPRGPFEHIRWFCKDGAVLPAAEGACHEHGGGVQHGEWNTRTLMMRSKGYLVANLLADIKPPDFVGDNPSLDELRQILLEQFLIANDDGWVFRRARYYRGAMQVEDEQMGASRLLMALVGDKDWRNPTRYLLLREAARMLPLNAEPQVGSQARALAIEIGEADPGFAPLRVKIHGIPDAQDAELVRDYAKGRGKPELAQSYERLATLLDVLNAPQTAVRQIDRLAGETRDANLKRQLRTAVKRLRNTASLAERASIAAELGVEWRRLFERSSSLTPLNRIRLLLASLAMEQEMYTVGNQLVDHDPSASRATRLQWLRLLSDSLYGSGLLSERQRQAIDQRMASLEQTGHLRVTNYYNGLRYLARVPQWAQRTMEFQFALTIERWSALTPMAYHFVPDRLRGGPLLAYTRLLDGLIQDGNTLFGIHNRLFGQEVGTGLRALNPGLRRGVLRLPPTDGGDFHPDGIYLLPSTTPELPPIAGILTRGEGSSLSHVQLLARNLGIPNVVIDEERVAQIKPHIGRSIVLAVSPRGAVEIGDDGPEWQAIFGREVVAEDVVIDPDLAKLDLGFTDLLPLRDIRSRDSGRIVGPKAANLGELRHAYPDAVNPGLVIPFGVFRALLDQAMESDGRTVFEWMRSEYGRIRDIPDAATRQQQVKRLLARLRRWITGAEPDKVFRQRLRNRMTEVFGDAEAVGVFVRSDTNVEDLPGFTGAGLNLTAPNVIGFEAVVQAIQRVWASPFTERAFAWRQSHMRQPENVYPAVLLLKTFAAEKSGVLVTADVETGDRHWLSIAVGEGVGGAVEGQAAEELRVHGRSGEVRLLAQASAPLRSEPAPRGGIRKVPASGRDTVLAEAEIKQLRALAVDVTQRFPLPAGGDGLPVTADIEFGFRGGELALFQIRPFVESKRARRSSYLISMDRDSAGEDAATVDLSQAPQHPGRGHL